MSSGFSVFADFPKAISAFEITGSRQNNLKEHSLSRVAVSLLYVLPVVFYGDFGVQASSFLWMKQLERKPKN